MKKITGRIAAVGIGGTASETVAGLIVVAAVALLCVFAGFLAGKAAISLIARVTGRNENKWTCTMLRNKVFHRLSRITAPLVIYALAPAFPVFGELSRRVASAWITLSFVLVADGMLKSADEIYRTYEISRTRPIKGMLQILKMAAFIAGGVIIVSTLMGESPAILLGGLGALSAVAMLVFQSSIVGFVAGLQLVSNDMIRIGDWIQAPKHDADGIVVDLALTTVKVQNFDRTITSIPANALVSDSFKNWRSVELSGVRRIIRTIFIDINSISFCNEEMLGRLPYIEYLGECIKALKAEGHVDARKPETGNGPEVTAMEKSLTNIGAYRIYVSGYLRNHPDINKELAILVRMLSPTPNGLPVEIQAFANTTDAAKYENIQAGITDHLLAMLPVFGLRAFQAPSGRDLAALQSEVGNK